MSAGPAAAEGGETDESAEESAEPGAAEGGDGEEAVAQSGADAAEDAAAEEPIAEPEELADELAAVPEPAAEWNHRDPLAVAAPSDRTELLPPATGSGVAAAGDDQRSQERLPGADLTTGAFPSLSGAAPVAKPTAAEDPRLEHDGDLQDPWAEPTDLPMGSDEDWQEAPTGEVPLRQLQGAAPNAVADLPLAPPVAAATEPAVADSADAATEGATRILRRPRLEEVEGDRAGTVYFLGMQTTVIGRAGGSQVQLLEEAVSRRHAEILASPDGHLLRDLGSENGTYVNGKRKKEHLLQPGDVIQVGPRRLVYHGA